MPNRRILFASLFLSCAFSVLIGENVFAQLRMVPAPRAKAASTKENKSARTQSLTAMMLPFWDDFSFASGDAPNDTLWENSASVWVNAGVGINTPSIYSATFDGLDSIGLPYSGEVLLNGYADKLISRPIRLDAVGAADRNKIYLTFFYQWQGNREGPDDEDFLAVEFKNKDDEWIEKMRIETRSSLDKTKFYDTILQVTGGDEIFHDDFQFRFRSFGRLSGPYDVWNIDYVYLNKRGSIDLLSFPDRALGSEVSSLLGRYRSVPFEHFVGNGEFDSITFDIQHLRNESPAAISYKAYGTFRSYIYTDTDTTYLDHTRELYDQPSFDIDPAERLHIKTKAFPDSTTDFEDGAGAVDIHLKIELNSKDSADTEDTSFIDAGIDALVNDTISSTYYLRDFYAYDDGTAERAVLLSQPSNRALYEFDLLTPEPAILYGFDIYMPDYGITSNMNMDFIVHGPDGSKPAKQPRLVIADKTITRQGRDNFLRVQFEGLQVEDKFYVGWIAPTGSKPRVGIDISNDTGDKIWINTNGFWEQNPDDIHGSLMIRPFFGEGEIVTGIPNEEKGLTIFPNPNKGEFTIRGRYDALTILSSTGQQINYREEKRGETSKVVFQAPPALYLVRISKGTKTTTEKIIVVP